MPPKSSSKRRGAHARAPRVAPRPAAAMPAASSAAAIGSGVDARPVRRRRSGVGATVWELLAAESPVWIVLIVALPILAIGLELTVGPFLDAAPGVDTDFWWHLATGEWVLDHHRIPTADPFSWTHGGEEWIAHEWLAATVMALLWRVGGYAAEIVFTVAVGAVGYWRLLTAARFYGLSRRAAALLTLIWGGVFFRSGVIVVRPQVWSWALLAVLCAELAAYDTGRRRRLWLLPPLFAIWVNVNLTVMIGFGCLGAFLLDRLVRRRIDRHLIAVGALSGLALLATPYHVRLFELIFTYLDGGAIRRQFVMEWMPPRWGDDQNIPFWLALPLVVPAVWFLVRRVPHFWPGAPLLVLAYQSLQSVRYIPIYVLLALVFTGWLAGRYRGARPQAVSAPVEPPLIPRRPWVAATAAGAAALMLLLALTVSPSQFRQDPFPWSFPAGAADVYLQDYSGKRLFNTYDFGGYLIHRFEETGDRVSMDGREEMYGELPVRRYFYYIAGRPGWQDYFLEQGIDVAMLRRIDQLAVEMSQDPGWRLVYAGDALLFVRAELAPQPET